jgi:predicted DNA-binding protein
MTTTPKGNPLLSVRLPVELNQLLNEQSTATGDSRSDIAMAL